MNDVLSGQIQLVVIGVPAVAPHIKAAETEGARPGGAAARGRAAEVPTVAEAGCRIRSHHLVRNLHPRARRRLSSRGSTPSS